jgi:hypothetical protein
MTLDNYIQGDYDSNAPFNQERLEPQEDEEVSRNELYLELKEIWKVAQEFENMYLANQIKKLMDKF